MCGYISRGIHKSGCVCKSKMCMHVYICCMYACVLDRVYVNCILKPHLLPCSWRWYIEQLHELFPLSELSIWYYLLVLRCASEAPKAKLTEQRLSQLKAVAHTAKLPCFWPRGTLRSTTTQCIRRNNHIVHTCWEGSTGLFGSISGSGSWLRYQCEPGIWEPWFKFSLSLCHCSCLLRVWVTFLLPW